MKNYVSSLLVFAVAALLTSSCARAKQDYRVPVTASEEADSTPLFFIANIHGGLLPTYPHRRIKLSLFDDGTILYRSDEDSDDLSTITLEPDQLDRFLKRLYKPLEEHKGPTYFGYPDADWLEVVGLSDKHGPHKLSLAYPFRGEAPPLHLHPAHQNEYGRLAESVYQALAIADEIIAELEATNTATPYTESVDWIWLSNR